MTPNTQLRFRSANNRWSRWLRASELRIDRDRIYAPGQRAGWRIAEISRIEARNVCGARTVLAIAGVSVMVVTMVVVGALGAALETASRKSHKSRTRGRRSRSSRGKESIALAVAGAISNGVITAAIEADAIHDPHQPWKPRATTPSGAAHLFSRVARRRSRVRWRLGVEAGANSGAELLTAAYNASVRLSDLLELGGGIRLVDKPLQRDEAGTVRRETALLGFSSLGAHLPLSNRVGLPVGVELGRGKKAWVVKMHAGLRIQLAGTVELTAFAYNPMFVSLDPRPADNLGRWSFVHGGELAAAW